MKLSRGKLLETLRRKNEGWTTYQARKIAGISVRRVNQVLTTYRETGEPPHIGRHVGRPLRPIDEDEVALVRAAYERYRVSASTLERLIRRDSERQINHNRLHRILCQLGFAEPLGQVVIRKKTWIRYERRHSLTAVHIDWHQRPNDGPWVYAVEDDASRKLLALLETDSATQEESIHGLELGSGRQRTRSGRFGQPDHGSGRRIPR